MNTVELIAAHFESLAARQTASTAPPRILAIDDDPAVLVMLRECLANAQFDVICVQSGQEAIDRIADGYVFNLVLLDLKLPGIGGVEVLRRLKALIPDVPVVFYTGYPHSEDMMEATKIGYFGLIEKPTTCAQLIERLREIFRLHRIG